MNDDAKKDMFSRRGFLGVGSAALAARDAIGGGCLGQVEQRSEAIPDKS